MNDLSTPPRISLDDRFDLSVPEVLLNGTQALVRLMLIQKARDMVAGLNTAGYVTGYRGSPLGTVDMQMTRASKHLAEADVLFQEGLNEDLAATAIWGSQQAELRGEGRFDGVFGLWYGKGPGVDRSGDAMRHANMAGTSTHGGVLMAMGDDHTGESSTVLHQSEWALVDACMPIVSPAGVQEILDFGVYGYALSRFSGLWVGLKTMKDTVEATAVVDGRPDRMSLVTPAFDMPEGGLNIRLVDTPHAQESRIADHKRAAAEAFAYANKIDRRVWGTAGAKIGFVAAGKNWLDLQHALGLLGIDQSAAEQLGITSYKIGQTYPLDTRSFLDWAEGLELIVVIEEKRKLLEGQIKDVLFDQKQRKRVYGWFKKADQASVKEELFPVKGALDPTMIAQKLGQILIEEGRNTDKIISGLQGIERAQKLDNAQEISARIPYFCSGCPHNSSTKVPEGSRGYAGIGCHFMAQWMDRDTLGFTHMGGEGANWIGESPFSKTQHVFQNIGDGTYNHSGVQAIRAALAAQTRITYKILFNDAVAMTGGQRNDGALSADRIAREVLAMGVRRVEVVFDAKEEPERSDFPENVGWTERADLDRVQKELRETDGVSVLLYIQTCAAEKRRRRKRGQFPDINKRVFINTDVCEGCGDCGTQSNCVSIVPVETEFGRKRAIDQSSCNKDFSCLKGFCPSFVTVADGTPRKSTGKALNIPDIPMPCLPDIDGTWNVVVTGVGGTGVVTIGAVVAQAAQLDGKGAAMMEMAGLAQKGGAVHIHLRLAERPDDISAIRVATGEADAVIGGDLVVTAGAKTVGLMTTGRTAAVVNTHETVTGDFTRNRDFALPTDQLTLALQARLRDGLIKFDATELARSALGDAIYSNMVLLGAAWQSGLVPLSDVSLRDAIRLNGAAVDGNLGAFDLGRWAVFDPDMMTSVISSGQSTPAQPTLDEKIARRADHIQAHSGRGIRREFLHRLAEMPDDEIRLAVSEGYHKLLTYKDEYEVARLHLSSLAKAREAFEGPLKLTYHLAPPMLSGTTPDGRPKKRGFGSGTVFVFRILAAVRGVRGTWLDVFGRTEERRMERALIAQYEEDIAHFIPMITHINRADILALLKLPLEIRGFGPVKAASVAEAAKTRARLIGQINNKSAAPPIAAE